MLVRIAGKVVVCTESTIPEGFASVLITRKTVLGNYGIIAVDSKSRAASVAAHKQWLSDTVKDSKHEVTRKLKRLGKKVATGNKLALVCHCKPKACHGDNYVPVIMDYAAYYSQVSKQR